MTSDFKRQITIFKKPTFHFHRFLFIFSILFCVVSMILIFVTTQLQDIVNSLIEMTNLPEEASNELRSGFLKLSLLSFFSYVTTGLFIFFYSLHLSKKFSGPVMVIINLLKQMQSGNYKITRQLRDGDELKEILIEVHELAQTLQAKFPEKSA